MRIALCLSGQMRTYETCYENLKKYLIAPFQPDVFIHTWKNTGMVTHLQIEELIRIAWLKSQYYIPEYKVTYEKLQDLYSPKQCVIEEFKDTYTEELYHIKVPELLKKSEPRYYKGALPMFYKMKACNELKTQWENKYDFQYDMVIRLRPDLMIQQALPQEIFNHPDILWYSDCDIDLSYQISDKFAVANSEIMNYYTSVWEKLGDYWQQPLGDGEWEHYRLGERLMKYHMSNASFFSKPFSIDCYIYREQPVSKGIVGKIHSWRSKILNKLS